MVPLPRPLLVLPRPLAPPPPPAAAALRGGVEAEEEKEVLTSSLTPEVFSPPSPTLPHSLKIPLLLLLLMLSRLAFRGFCCGAGLGGEANPPFPLPLRFFAEDTARLLS